MKRYRYIILVEKPVGSLEDYFNMQGKDGYKYIDSVKLSDGSVIFIMQKEENGLLDENLNLPKYDKVSEGYWSDEEV